MITRTYFVTYARAESTTTNLVGSLVVTSNSLFPQTKEVFSKAVNFVQKEYGATVTGFERVI